MNIGLYDVNLYWVNMDCCMKMDSCSKGGLV